MSAYVRNPLANLFSAEPRWPDPGESIGDFVKFVDGKKSCWKAKGKAREIFETLAEDIKTYLDESVDSIPGSDWVTWSIYMIGKTPHKAAPVVMFFCEEPQTRKKVQEAVKKSGLLSKHPGIKTGNAALPPDIDQLELLASDAVSRKNTAKNENCDFNLTINATCCKVSITGQHGSNSSTRSATIGGIVKHNGDDYIFTAGHLLDGASLPARPKVPKPIDEDWDIDSSSDEDEDTVIGEYDEDFIDAMSRASNTPVDARSERNSSVYSSDDESSDGHSTGSFNFSDAAIPAENQLSDQAVRRMITEINDSKDILLPITIRHTTQNNKTLCLKDLQRTGTVPTPACGDDHQLLHSIDLDYALVKIKDADLLAMKESAVAKGDANFLWPTNVVKDFHRDADILAYTTSGGLMTGTFYGTPSYTRLPNSKTYQEVYMVHFDGPLAKGDCGSWVIDAETRDLYGHIIAGCEGTGTAYIMPAHKVFEDAENRLGGHVLLKCDPASEAISLIEPAEITKEAYLEELQIPDLHPRIQHEPGSKTKSPQPYYPKSLKKILRELGGGPGSYITFIIACVIFDCASFCNTRVIKRFGLILASLPMIIIPIYWMAEIFAPVPSFMSMSTSLVLGFGVGLAFTVDWSTSFVKCWAIVIAIMILASHFIRDQGFCQIIYASTGLLLVNALGVEFHGMFEYLAALSKLLGIVSIWLVGAILALNHELENTRTVKPTVPTSGDSLGTSKLFYDASDSRWMITSVVLVLLMSSIVWFFCSSYARKNSAVCLNWLLVMSVSVIAFGLFFRGYSLTCFNTARESNDGLANFGFKVASDQPFMRSIQVPEPDPNFTLNPDQSSFEKGFPRLFPKTQLDTLDFAAMAHTYHYHRNHTAIFLAVCDKAPIRLHKGYKILSISSKKIYQQCVGPFTGIERIWRLAYRLAIPEHWLVYPVFTIAQLEPALPGSNPFNQPCQAQPGSIYVDRDTETSRSSERVLYNCIIRKDRGSIMGYLVRHLIQRLRYGPEFNQWYTTEELQNIKELVAKYESQNAKSMDPEPDNEITANPPKPSYNDITADASIDG